LVDTRPKMFSCEFCLLKLLLWCPVILSYHIQFLVLLTISFAVQEALLCSLLSTNTYEIGSDLA